MKIPKYVTVEEVKRICKELKISDWTKKKERLAMARISLRKAELKRLA